jgi:hypothetical protein
MRQTVTGVLCTGAKVTGGAQIPEFTDVLGYINPGGSTARIA